MYVGNILHLTAANLYHFMWWRVVCDEAHEIILCNTSGPSNGLNTVVGFQSRHRWYVSGTPFPHGLNSLRAALKVRLKPSFHYLSWRPKLAARIDGWPEPVSITRQLGPSTLVVETGLQSHELLLDMMTLCAMLSQLWLTTTGVWKLWLFMCCFQLKQR